MRRRCWSESILWAFLVLYHLGDRKRIWPIKCVPPFPNYTQIFVSRTGGGRTNWMRSLVRLDVVLVIVGRIDTAAVGLLCRVTTWKMRWFSTKHLSNEALHMDLSTKDGLVVTLSSVGAWNIVMSLPACLSICMHISETAYILSFGAYCLLWLWLSPLLLWYWQLGNLKDIWPIEYTQYKHKLSY